jgi:hypothetical protein
VRSVTGAPPPFPFPPITPVDGHRLLHSDTRVRVGAIKGGEGEVDVTVGQEGYPAVSMRSPPDRVLGLARRDERAYRGEAKH